MRIAVQIAGDFRFIHLTYLSLLRSLDSTKNEIDFFIHTWKKENTGYGTLPFPGRGDWHNEIVVFSTEEGLNLYKPKAALVEDYEEKKELHPRSITIQEGLRSRFLSMFYSIHMANELRKRYEQDSSTRYDLVVKYRTDCFVNHSIPAISSKEIESKIPFICIPNSSFVEIDHITDFIAWGTPDHMDIYTSIYPVWKNREFNDPSGVIMGIYSPEQILISILEGSYLKRDFCYFSLIKMDGPREATRIPWSYQQRIEFIQNLCSEFLESKQIT